MSGDDLSDLLREWPYEPGRINVRKVIGECGRAKIQVRIDLGILQLEWDGRPDGQRPQGFASLLDLQRERLERHLHDRGGPAGFALSASETAALREEAVQLYHRYVALFALREYGAVIRDTQHSLAIFDLCRDFAEAEQDRMMLEQFRAQVLTMRTRSEAELALEAGKPKDALAAIDRGLSELQLLLGDKQQFEQANEVQLLRGMRDVLVPKLPASQKAELQERLRAALDAENYELAAILRDELRLM